VDNKLIDNVKLQLELKITISTILACGPIGYSFTCDGISKVWLLNGTNLNLFIDLSFWFFVMNIVSFGSCI
jgi:hypothetical protein